MKIKFLVPLFIFIGLSFFLFKGLYLDPREVPSPLINKPAPQFDLTQLHEPDQRFKRDDMLGRVWLFNVWASWCVSCRAEHPLLVELSKANIVPIVGLNYKDKREDAKRWLTELGNPYVLSAYDNSGRVGIDYGVYGVPETYLIDKKGIIRYKQIGPVTVDALQNHIIPMIKTLEQES